MRTVEIVEHLTQSKLSAALLEITGDAWAGDEVMLPGSRRRYDVAFRRGEATVLVEYDGDAHYRSSLHIKADREKDALAREHGVELVRLPYWVQLDDLTLRHYFGLEARIVQDFPHGFITTRWFPASFCELGVERFSRELAALPTAIQGDVVRSLRERALEHGVEYVLPTALRHLAE